MKEIKMLVIKGAVHETKEWMLKKKKKIIKERIRDMRRDRRMKKENGRKRVVGKGWKKEQIRSEREAENSEIAENPGEVRKKGEEGKAAEDKRIKI